jgi:hypothetical protein
VGLTDEQIDAIESDAYMNSPLLTAREKTAVLWAEHVTKNTARYRDDMYQEVSKFYSDAEIVELTLMSAFFNMTNRFQNALQVELEESNEVSKIKKSARVNPEDLRDYMESLLKSWPDSFPDTNKK